MFLSNILAQQGHEPERLQVTAVSSFDKVGDDFRVTRMDLEVNGSVPGIDGPAFEEAAQAPRTAARCRMRSRTTSRSRSRRPSPDESAVQGLRSASLRARALTSFRGSPLT